MSQAQEEHDTVSAPSQLLDAINSSPQLCTNAYQKGDKMEVAVVTWSDIAISGQHQLNQVDCFRLRTSLIEIVEELKLRRKNDVENEDRIQLIAKEKYELERKHDGDVSKIKNLQDENQKQLTESRRKYEGKIRVLEEKTKQDSVHRESLERELAAMKDEMRNLQLSKYSLEKCVREQERKALIQSDSAEQHLQQLSGVERKIQAFSGYCQKLFDSQRHLEKQVMEAKKLIKALKYVNEHQKCLIGQNKEVIASLEVRLLEANIKRQSQSSVSMETQLEQDIMRMKQQLEGREAELGSLDKEMVQLKARYNETLEKLDDAHTLIERHLSNAATHRDDARVLRGENEDLESQCGALKEGLDNLQRESDIQTTLHRQAVAQWGVQSEENATEMVTLNSELDKCTENCQQLEELNSSWARHNLELTEGLQTARAKLDVPKADTDVQTSLSLFDLKDSSSQTSVDIVTAASQTDSPTTHPSYTQTHCPVVVASHTQTDRTPQQAAGTQTKVAAVANVGVLATTDMAAKESQTLPVRVYGYHDFKDPRNDKIDPSVLQTDRTMTDHLHTDRQGNQTVAMVAVPRVFEGHQDGGENILQNHPRDDQTDEECSQKDVGNGDDSSDCNETQIDQETENTGSEQCLLGNPAQPCGDVENDGHGLSSVEKETAKKFIQDAQRKHLSSLSSLSSLLISPDESPCKQTDEGLTFSKPRVESQPLDGGTQKWNSQESPKTSTVSSLSKSKTSADSKQDKYSPKSLKNISQTSSKSRFQAEPVDWEAPDKVMSESPKISSSVLSLRKSRREAKIADKFEKSGTSPDVHKTGWSKSGDKFALNSGKTSGLLFEGKTLLSAYMASRGSDDAERRQTRQRDVTDVRQTSARGASVIGQKNVTDVGQTSARGASVSGQKNVTDDGQTSARGALTSGQKNVMDSRQIKTDVGQTSVRGASASELKNVTDSRQTKDVRQMYDMQGVTGQTDKLSPYSRYSAMFQSGFKRIGTLKQSDGAKDGTEGCKDTTAAADLRRNDNSSIRGILKDFSERRSHTKSVHFHEGPVSTHSFMEYSGEQSLFSDGEEDEGSSQFVSLDDFQMEQLISDPKKRKLE